MKKLVTITIFLLPFLLFGQKNLYRPDLKKPSTPEGWKLVWNDEFSEDGLPNPANWTYETGFVRNNELQYYQKENASVRKGVLVIEGKHEKIKNQNYNPESEDWRKNRGFAEYTSACVITRNLHNWLYGRFEIRARIDTCSGLWPAIWMLGISKPWPSNGEIDIMEFYRYKGEPSILANTAWGTEQKWKAAWNTQVYKFTDIANGDSKWVKKFHIWRMDWNKDSICIYLDNKLLNFTDLSKTVNPDGFNPFRQPAYLLINLAIGEPGGDPSKTKFPVKYEVDYVRVWQRD